MKKSKMPSPARSVGGISTAKKITIERHALSTDSPGHNRSTRFSAAGTRQSVLSENTDIEQPARKSWWKKLGEDSCNIIMTDHPELENDESVSMRESQVLDLIGLEVLSQDSIKHSVLESDTSVAELPSIAVPQRKLFKQQINPPQEKIDRIIENNKDIFLSSQQTSESNIDLDKDVQVQPKKLFGQANKPRSKPVFPTELLSITANKTAEIPNLNLKRKEGVLFGNRAVIKRKNMYYDCFASDSNEELPEVQTRKFGFNKQPDHNLIARTSTNIRLSTSFNVNDWKELASSTIIENQTGKTSLVSSRLSQFNDENLNIDNSNSRFCKNKSKSIQETCLNQHNSSKRTEKSCDRTLTNESISENAPLLNQHSHIKDMDEDNTLNGDISMNIEHQIDNNISVESIEMNKEKINMTAKNISVDKVSEDKEVGIDSNDKKQQENNVSYQQKNNTIENKKTDTEESYENRNIMGQKDNELENDATTVTDKTQIGKCVMDDDNQENNKTEKLNAIETEEQNATEETNTSYTENQLASETAGASEIEEQDDSQTEEVAIETKEVSSCITGVASEAEEHDDSETEDVASCITELASEGDKQEVANEIEEQDACDTDEVASEAEEQNASKTEDFAGKFVEQSANETDEINDTETEDRNDNLVEQNEIYSEAGNKENKIDIEEETSNKQINKETLSSPEVVLHDKTKHMADSIVARRNTTVSKTLYNTLKPQPSSILLRETTGLSDGTNDSSANRSGWDSHRTTRKTLRQTFGKDFSPRKSLRTLVMEKSAKRQSQFIQDQRQAEITDTVHEIHSNIEEKENFRNSNIVAEEQVNCERIDDTLENLEILDNTYSNSKSKDEIRDNLDKDKTYSNSRRKDNTLENSRILNKTHEKTQSNNEPHFNSRTINKTHEISELKNKSEEISRALDKTLESSKLKNKTLKNSKNLNNTRESLKSADNTLKNLSTLNKTHESTRSKNKTLENSRTVEKTNENSKSKNKSLEISRASDKTQDNLNLNNKTLENSRTIHNKTHDYKHLKTKILENSANLDKSPENSKSKNKTLENSKTSDKTRNNSKFKNRTLEGLRSLDTTQKNSSTRKPSQENRVKSPDISKRKTSLSLSCEATNSTAHYVTIDETYEDSSSMGNTRANSRLTKSVNYTKENKLSESCETANYETIDETHENWRTVDKRSDNFKKENQLPANYTAMNSQKSSKSFDNTQTYNETANNTKFTIVNEIPLAYSTSYNHHSTTYNASVTRGGETNGYFEIINEDDETRETCKNINEDNESHEKSESINDDDETNEYIEREEEDDEPHENSENDHDDTNDYSEHIEEDDEQHEISENLDEDDERQENSVASNEFDEDVNDESHQNSEIVDDDDNRQEYSENISEDDGTNDNSDTETQSDAKIVQANNEIVNAENTIVNRIPLAYSTPYVNFPCDEASIDQDESMEKSLDAAAHKRVLKKIEEHKIATKRKIEEEILNCQKRSKFSFFKVPQAPVRLRPVQSKLKPKQVKSVGYDLMPACDLNYKPPKKYKPNASWVTKRLYKFLEDKLRPKYNFKAGVRAEKFVETLFNFTKDIRRHHPAAPHHLVLALKLEMAKLNIVTTHYDFYDFFHEFMPREIRIKVNPDVVNGIPLPKEGGFSEIIKQN